MEKILLYLQGTARKSAAKRAIKLKTATTQLEHEMAAASILLPRFHSLAAPRMLCGEIAGHVLVAPDFSHLAVQCHLNLNKSLAGRNVLTSFLSSQGEGRPSWPWLYLLRKL